MANSADPDQLSSESQLIWIYTVFKGRTYPGSAGLGLSIIFSAMVVIWCAFPFNDEKKKC